MEDYELANAQLWDLRARKQEDDGRRGPDPDEWQVVSRSKKQKKPQKPVHSQDVASHMLLPVARTEKGRPPASAKPPHHAPNRGRQDPASIKSMRREARKRAPKLIDIEDSHVNEAQTLWRNHERPTSTIRIPDELILPKESEQRYQAIALQHKTFVFSEHAHGVGGLRSFGIWGTNADDVVATKDAIQAWIDGMLPRSVKSDRGQKFAKLVSLTPVLRARYEKRWEREVRKHRYRQIPPPDKPFGAIGTFHWPAEEYDAQEILGKDCEALDSVRMDCECYVVYVKEKGHFQIMGKPKNVTEGLLRLRRTCFQITAQQRYPVRVYLVHPSKDMELPSHVNFKTYHRPLVARGAQAERQASSPRAHGACQQTSQTVMRSTQDRVRKTLLNGLKKLHYYRGNLQLRLRLGTFLATRWRAEEQPLTTDEYQKMILEPEFVGEVTQEFGDRAAELRALRIFQESTDLLVPMDAVSEDLRDVRPVFSATFIFTDKGGDLRLTVTWREVRHGVVATANFEVASQKWSRLERDTGSAISILDINVTELVTGLGWQFGVEATQVINESRLPEHLATFASRLKLDAALIKKPSIDKPFVVFHAVRSRVRSLEQRVSYRFGMHHSDYTLELTRFQRFDFADQRRNTEQDETTVYEPRWGVGVYRDEWDTMFAQNARLPIGSGADWEDSTSAWFPRDLQSCPVVDEDKDAGFAELMSRLAEVADVVCSAETEDLMGGMKVQ